MSTNPSTSSDGRYVAFESYATNLGTGSSGSGVQDIYVYDSQTNTTEWITHTPSGGAANGNSYSPSISGDGRYVTFASTATNLGPGGSGSGIKDIYVYDRVAHAMTWITHSPTRGPASNSSANPVISADGKIIAFQSTAKNLGPGGSEYYVSDIYTYNRESGVIEWITHTNPGKTPDKWKTANGASMNPTISADGRYIAFETVATNLGPKDYESFGYGSNVRDIFCYDRTNKTMKWVTIRPPEVVASPSGRPFTDPFTVNLTMNEPGDIYYYKDSGPWQLYIAPVPITTNTKLYFKGQTPDGRTSNISSEYYFISDAIQPTVWASPSGGTYYNMVKVELKMDMPGTIYYSTDNFSHTNTYTEPLKFTKTTNLQFYGISSGTIPIRSKTGDETYEIKLAPIGGINSSICSDVAGNYRIAFESGNILDQYTELLGGPGSASTSGGSSSAITYLEAVYDYLFALFGLNSTYANLTVYDNIYVYDSIINDNILITHKILGGPYHGDGGPANGSSSNPSISGDGKYVAFETFANNLGIDPSQPYGSNMPHVNFYANLRKDIFIAEIVPTSLFYMNWVTRNPNWGPANGNSYTPSLNSDGKVIAYSSSANNLGPGGTGKYRDIFMESQNPIVIIKQPPTVTANPVGGTYSSAQTVTLTTVDPDSTATTYYTKDGSDPKTSGTRLTYTSPIQIATTTLLRYIAVDPDGNWSPNYSQTYTINIPPSITVTITELEAAASYMKNYYETHSKTIPTNIIINGKTLTMPQLLYVLVTGTINISVNNLNPITLKSVNPATSPSGSITSGTITKTSYINYAKSVQNYINTNGRVPNYLTTNLGKMQIKYMVYMYSKIINYYALNSNKLPNSVSMAP